ncbi:MAG: 3-deoxy-manno-octulosonate cytidylyltransferase [Saprospiraceae bacterium]
MKTLGIIPARFASTRFPGKPLALLGGKPIIQWVWERARESNALDAVIVATDDDRIAECVFSFGGHVVMTRPDHPSGTDRCAEVLLKMGVENWDFAINIQGDEPFIDPAAINLLAGLLQEAASPDIATLAREINDEASLFNPNVVKAVVGQNGKALYFTRHPAPFQRGKETSAWLAGFPYLQHIGIYGFKARVLTELAKLQPSPLEQAESLEQLRWLENGYSIAVGVTAYQSIGIDTPEDLEAAEKMLYK